MRRSSAIAAERMKFLQALAVGLRAELAKAARVPLPETLAMLIRKLDSDSQSGEAFEDGTSRTERSSRIGR
jgi:hypothetical protein